MCGIFGFATKNNNKYNAREIQKMTEVLFKLSESRGKEAAGLAVKSEDSIDILKSPLKSSDFIKGAEYKKFSQEIFKKNPFVVIGHSRLATHGSEYQDENNQPVIKDHAVGVHNGIIANDKELWKKFPELKKESDVDTEVFLALLQMFLKDKSIENSIKEVFRIVEGSASLAIFFDNRPDLILTTNTGSLYICKNKTEDSFVFASERYILEEFINKVKTDNFAKEFISQVRPAASLIFNFKTDESVKIVNHSAGQYIGVPSAAGNYLISPELKKEMEETWERIYSGAGLRRCKKCLFTSTMPFIEFDENGVCDYCRNHKKFEFKGEEELKKIVSKYRRNDGKPDCIVPFSGGRDSSYGLHYIKKVLNMNPIAYTYDWGVLTDLGRRNEARVCGKLGVEHLVISADIRKKRRNIKKNIEAWLKRPELGMIPLFMAGDKAHLKFPEVLMKKNNIKISLDSATEGLEDDLIKIGFAGIRIPHRLNYDVLPLTEKMKVAGYYLSQYFLNPSYLNESLFDTALSTYYAFIYHPKNLHIFRFIEWNEEKILSTIINEYGWEKEKDTVATWRIDDGTVPFYNYIYLAVAGITENDIFRSIQIREGQIDRERAYELVKEENRPRFESLEWYAKIIGFDINKAIRVINAMPKKYDI